MGIRRYGFFNMDMDKDEDGREDEMAFMFVLTDIGLQR